MNGRGCHTPRHRPLASVVPPIDGFNRLFRFVQHPGQRCNGYHPRRDIDGVDNSADGRDEDFIAIALDNVNVVGARLDHLSDVPEGLTSRCDDPQPDELVDEVRLIVVAQDIVVSSLQELSAKGFYIVAVVDAAELEDPVFVVRASALDNSPDVGKVYGPAPLEVSCGGGIDHDANFAGQSVGA